MSQSKTFESTKKLLPFFIFGMVVLIPVYFAAVAIFDDSNCFTGNLYYTCVQKVHEARNWLDLTVWALAGTGILSYAIVIVNDVRKARAIS